MVEKVLQHCRFALRQLRRSPAFAATTILTLALGIGATTAMFSVVNTVLMKPLPFPGQDRLMWVQKAVNTHGISEAQASAGEHLSYPDFFDWRAQNSTFEGMACYRSNGFTLTDVGQPEHLSGELVSADFFHVLQVSPLFGRGFSRADEKPGARSVVLSYSLWQSKFNSAREVLGRTIRLNGHSYTVTGVMPRDFVFPIESPPPALWTNLGEDAAGEAPYTTQRGLDVLGVIARLKRGASIAQGRADLGLIARRLANEYPETDKQFTAAIVQPELEHLTGNIRPALRVLFAAVALLLLIACANVAGLLLARNSRRLPEIALRTSLGASRIEIIWQVLVESVMLSLLGGVAGLGLFGILAKTLPRFMPSDVPRMDQISMDVPVLLFVLAISVATGLVFGVLPAWRMSQLQPSPALREGSRSTGARAQNRVQGWLVIAETAVGLVLLVGSGLLIRSFVRVLDVKPGFDPKQVLTANLDLSVNRYSPEQEIAFYNQLLFRLAALPGVQSAAAGWPMPLSGSRASVSFEIEGHPTNPGDEPSEALGLVTPGYFKTLRVPIRAGRPFNERDDSKGTPVVIINQSFARKYFPGEDPVGKRMRADLDADPSKAPMREIVGVVGDVKRTSLTAEFDPQYYLPWAQAPLLSPTLCIRTAGDPLNIVSSVRSVVSDLDRNIPLYRVNTLEKSESQAAAQPRFQTLLVTCFASVALLLSAVGLYSVLSYMVVQRTTEIGLRMALGAQRQSILGLILGRGLIYTCVGLVGGVVISVVVTRFMASLLYGVEALDPISFVAMAAILIFVCFIASAAPALRAAGLDPMKTLRDQ
ncbi:MAG TPA: ABC transporter permease [Bryobacteraceae bacterium]|nr:ABC transporter permease [Bryobacteraceae bacterium]